MRHILRVFVVAFLHQSPVAVRPRANEGGADAIHGYNVNSHFFSFFLAVSVILHRIHGVGTVERIIAGCARNNTLYTWPLQMPAGSPVNVLQIHHSPLLDARARTFHTPYQFGNSGTNGIMIDSPMSLFWRKPSQW